MATFEIAEGSPGSGKSLYTARMARWLLNRNKNWYKKTGLKREIWSNLRFSEDFEKQGKDYIHYWSNLNDLIKLEDCDILWDEIATELDSRNFASLSNEVKRFLSQYRKRGNDIYANTQDFSMVDKRARLMVSEVKTLSKLMGSRDISTTKPPVKNPWGVILIRQVINYKEENPAKKQYEIWFEIFFIEKDLIKIYDTRQDIPIGKGTPLQHREMYCENPDCTFHKTVHD